MKEVLSTFQEEATKRVLKGVMGITSFEPVYSTLLPIQKKKLEKICGNQLDTLKKKGYFITIAYAYPNYAIRSIDIKKRGSFDKEAWNIYADWYPRLNNALNDTVTRLAQVVDGIPLMATLTGEAEKVNHVEDYYSMVVSHRIPGLLSGIGWKGKNELVVNPRYGCAIRLASIITATPMESTCAEYTGCGTCSSCLEVCSFLSQKDILPNYREQCRIYMLSLGLEQFVCGKCIKACSESPGLLAARNQNSTKSTIYYTQ